MNYSGIILTLFGITLVQSTNFYLLVRRRIQFTEAFRIVCVAAALNRLLFTGSGYIAGGLFSRKEELPFHKALGAFFISEFLFLSLWILLGTIYGAQVAVQASWLPLLFLPILIVLLYRRKEKILAAKDDFLNYIREVKLVIPVVLMLTLLNCGIFISYYFFLFRSFNFQPGGWEIIRIVSISVTLSYLSPLPSGLGFKEGAMSLLLMKAGLPFGESLIVALTDRFILTFFWAALGSVLGFDMIKEEMKKRFRSKDEPTYHNRKNMIKRFVSALVKATPRPLRRLFKMAGAGRLLDKILDKHDAELIFQKRWVREFLEHQDRAAFFWEQHRFLSELRTICSIGPESKILDVGCGISTVLHYLEGELFGIDPLADEYKKLYAYPKSMKIVKASGEYAPFAGSFFDVVFCTNVLDHVTTPEHTVNEINRVLKSDGFFVLIIEIFEKETDRGLEHPHSFTDADVHALIRDKFEILFDRLDSSVGLRGFAVDVFDEVHDDRIMVLKKIGDRDHQDDPV